MNYQKQQEIQIYLLEIKYLQYSKKKDIILITTKKKCKNAKMQKCKSKIKEERRKICIKL